MCHFVTARQGKKAVFPTEPPRIPPEVRKERVQGPQGLPHTGEGGALVSAQCEWAQFTQWCLSEVEQVSQCFSLAVWSLFSSLGQRSRRYSARDFCAHGYYQLLASSASNLEFIRQEERALNTVLVLGCQAPWSAFSPPFGVSLCLYIMSSIFLVTVYLLHQTTNYFLETCPLVNMIGILCIFTLNQIIMSSGHYLNKSNSFKNVVSDFRVS